MADPLLAGDWERLCYLLVKRLGGMAEFTAQELASLEKPGKTGYLKFEEGFTRDSLRVIAKGE